MLLDPTLSSEELWDLLLKVGIAVLVLFALAVVSGIVGLVVLTWQGVKLLRSRHQSQRHVGAVLLLLAGGLLLQGGSYPLSLLQTKWEEERAAPMERQRLEQEYREEQQRQWRQTREQQRRDSIYFLGPQPADSLPGRPGPPAQDWQ